MHPPGRFGRAIPLVQQPPAGPEQREEPVEIHPEVREPDLLEHPDRADRVERAVHHVPEVLVADLDPVGEPGLGDGLLRQPGPGARERDPDRAADGPASDPRNAAEVEGQLSTKGRSDEVTTHRAP
jgi:hypothetical protein